MAALRQLLNRGLQAGRRAATAPPRAPRSFFTTTGGSIHFPQRRQPLVRSSYDSILDKTPSIGEAVGRPSMLRNKYWGWILVAEAVYLGVYCVSGKVAPDGTWFVKITWPGD